MGHEDLKVDHHRLENSTESLALLKNEFDDIEKRRDDTRDIWGHDGARGAMDECASNMDYNRAQLSTKLDEMKKKVIGTLDAFVEVDGEPATSFDDDRPAR